MTFLCLKMQKTFFLLDKSGDENTHKNECRDLNISSVNMEIQITSISCNPS